MTSTIGSQPISEKEEDREGGRYNRTTRGYCSGKLPNGKDASIEAFGFARDAIGPTRRCTIVNNFIVIVLKYIMIPSFVSLDMFVV